MADTARGGQGRDRGDGEGGQDPEIELVRQLRLGSIVLFPTLYQMAFVSDPQKCLGTGRGGLPLRGEEELLFESTLSDVR